MDKVYSEKNCDSNQFSPGRHFESGLERNFKT